MSRTCQYNSLFLITGRLTPARRMKRNMAGFENILERQFHSPRRARSNKNIGSRQFLFFIVAHSRLFGRTNIFLNVSLNICLEQCFNANSLKDMRFVISFVLKTVSYASLHIHIGKFVLECTSL